MSSLLRVSQLQGDVCPRCGSVNKSKITQTHISSRIGKRNHKNTLGLVKRFHVCDHCGYTGRDNSDDIPFNTIAVREDYLKELLLIMNELLNLHQSTSVELDSVNKLLQLHEKASTELEAFTLIEL